MSNPPLRRQVSDILGVSIPVDGWEKTFWNLDVRGKITNRELIRILLVVCKRLEELETNATQESPTV